MTGKSDSRKRKDVNESSDDDFGLEFIKTRPARVYRSKSTKFLIRLSYRNSSHARNWIDVEYGGYRTKEDAEFESPFIRIAYEFCAGAKSWRQIKDRDCNLTVEEQESYKTSAHQASAARRMKQTLGIAQPVQYFGGVNAPKKKAYNKLRNMCKSYHIALNPISYGCHKSLKRYEAQMRLLAATEINQYEFINCVSARHWGDKYSQIMEGIIAKDVAN